MATLFTPRQPKDAQNQRLDLRERKKLRLVLAVALAQLGRLDEARSAVKTGLARNPAFTISRARAAWTAMSDHPTYLAQLEPILEGLRRAGVPEQ